MRVQLLSVAILCASALGFSQEMEVSAVVIPAFSFTKAEGFTNASDYGLGFTTSRSENWAVEFTLSRFQRFSRYPDAQKSTSASSADADTGGSIPVTGLLLYRFDSFGRWQPYVGGGLTYTFATPSGESAHAVDPTMSAGVDFNLTDRMKWKIDLKQLLDVPIFEKGDPSKRETTFATGLSFKF